MEEQAETSARLLLVRDLRPRVDQLSLSLKSAMESLMLRYVTNQDMALKKDDINTSMQRYEHLERISLLQQAVWKSVCLLMTPDEPTTDYLFWARWSKEGWKKRKLETRHSGEAQIIITAVLPFIGN